MISKAPLPTDYESRPEKMIPHLEASLRFNWQSFGEKHPAKRSAYYLRLGVIQARCQSVAISRALRHTDRPASRFLLLRWQCGMRRRALPSPAPFHKASPYPPKRKERYGYFTDPPDLFERKIEQDADGSASPIAKAARAYLDIIFVHPFDDGNARTALLALIYFMGRYDLHAPDMLILHAYPFKVGTDESFGDFIRLLEEMML